MNIVDKLRQLLSDAVGGGAQQVPRRNKRRVPVRMLRRGVSFYPNGWRMDDVSYIPRNRKTVTAAQQKRAAKKRRNKR